MAFLTKEAYERKARYVEKRMKKNKEIESLTEEQHDALSWLCAIRHEMHCEEQCFFHSESGEYAEFWGYIGVDEDGEIVKRIKSVGLPEFKWSFSNCALNLPDDDSVCYELGYTEEEIEEQRGKMLELAKKINNDIERYLLGVDHKFGVDYCPAGLTRIY